MFSRIEFFITETALGLRRHPAMASAAILCIAAALFVAGLVGLGMLNVNDLVRSEMERVRFNVYFHPETSRDDARLAAAQIAQLPGVAKTAFITREQGWQNIAGKDPELTKLVGENPLPDSMVVKATNIALIPALQAQIKDMKEVERTSDVPEISTFLLSSVKTIRYLGTIIGLVLGLISLVIIHHTIELTLYARRKEVQIMSLVGATPATVATPFLLEGIVYGLFGGFLAVVGLYFLYKYLSASVMAQFHTSLMSLALILTPGVLLVLAVGAGLGLLGSLVSVVKYLNQPRSKVTNA